MYICDTGAVAVLLTKVVMEISSNEAFAGKDIGVDEKVSVRHGFAPQHLNRLWGAITLQKIKKNIIIDT